MSEKINYKTKCISEDCPCKRNCWRYNLFDFATDKEKDFVNEGLCNSYNNYKWKK